MLNKNFTKSYTPVPWLIKRLLKGIATTHEDAINAGYDHRLACHVYKLRRDKGWKGVICTAENKWYYIPKERRNKAWELASEQQYVRSETND